MDDSSLEDELSPSEMRAWLHREILSLTRALELRITDATSFVTAFALGDITAKEAGERLDVYTKRWGDPIPGVVVDQDMSATTILRLRDEEVGRSASRRRDRNFDGYGR